jgi:hypothetical protein
MINIEIDFIISKKNFILQKTVRALVKVNIACTLLESLL